MVRIAYSIVGVALAGLITILTTTLGGQALLAMAGNKLVALIYGKSLLQMVWENPLIIFDLFW